MNCSEKAFVALKETPLGKTIEAYRNPRLSGNGSDYLNTEHRQELIDQSQIISWEENPDPVLIPSVGTIHTGIVRTRQGYEYDAVRGEAWVQETDSLGLATRPLGTSAGGVNRHWMLNHMGAGNNVGFLSLRDTYELEEDREKLTRIALASTAAALLSFGNEVQQKQTEEGYGVHEKNRFVYGGSHGGAVALVMNALDGDFGQEIRVTDAIAPSPSIKMESPKQWLKLGEQVVREPVRIPLMLARLGLRLAWHYRDSVELDHRNMALQLELCGGIFNGELSAAAHHIPSHKIIRVPEYYSDTTCNDGGLEQILTPETHPNVAFEETRGIHMSLMDKPWTLPILMGLNKAYQEQERGSNTLDAQKLFARARMLAKKQFPIAEDQMPAPTSPYRLAG